jgi:hypothetical protein
MNDRMRNMTLSLITIALAFTCGSCMKNNKADTARKILSEKVLIVLARNPHPKSHIIDVQDYVRNGESYIPFFSSKEAFQESTRGTGLGKPVWAIDRRLFVELAQTNQVLILNLGLPTEMRFTGAELKAIFPEPFTTNRNAQQEAGPYGSPAAGSPSGQP